MAKAKRKGGARSKRKAIKRRPVKRKPVKRRSKRKAIKRKPTRRKRVGKRLVKQVEKRSVERVMTGERKRRPRRKARMAGISRRRSVGQTGGGNKLLIGLAIGAAAIYFLTKKQSTTIPPNYQLPPVTQTGNYTRDTQSQDIINYAIAGGLALDAILKLIDKLNTSSDQEVENIYDVYHTSGTEGLEYYV